MDQHKTIGSHVLLPATTVFQSNLFGHNGVSMQRSLSLSLCILGILNAQAQHSLLLQKSYGDLGIRPRITNSGIYAVSSFDRDDDAVYLRDFDSPTMIVVRNTTTERQPAGMSSLRDLAIGVSKQQQQSLQRQADGKQFAGSATVKKSFLGAAAQLFADEGGTLTSPSGENISVRVKNRNDLSIRCEIAALQKEIRLAFSADLAYADLIGIDAKGNFFLLIERYLSEIPLSVRREVYTVSSEGTVLSILSVPMIKYCTTIKDFQIDADGALYHLMTTRDTISIMKWSGLTTRNSETISYPEEFLFTEHYNEYVTADEPQGTISLLPLTAGDRQFAVRLGEEYVMHTYSCTPKNLAPANTRAADGDTVRTPSWLIVGMNSHVAYKWGGFSTIAQYDAGLAAGKFAADIHTKGVSSEAVGVDCSGFVSRCWGLTYHSSTSNMPSITTQYATWDDLKPGDAVHKVGHVRLFIEKMPNGSLRIVEASGRDWATSYWSYAPSDLNGVYTPRYYNGMETDFSTQTPELLSVAVLSDSTVKLSWKCDTTDISGYRVYASSNGTQWNLAVNEAVLRDTMAIMTLKNAAASYRVSSVRRGEAAAESHWSNVLSAGNRPMAKKILIVDGFEKATGSWRGPGNIFVPRYGNAMAPHNLFFESVKNSQLSDPHFSLSGYDALFWMLGDESTEHETFSATEQSLVKSYLEEGGNLFVSGSEIGWDLVAKGTAADNDFYRSYLKASYRSDDAGSATVSGCNIPWFSQCGFVIGQTYEEDYPDEIDTAGGSVLCFRYGNLKGAGVCYIGTFGSSPHIGKIIYLGFPLETTASDSSFNLVINGALEFFVPLLPVERQSIRAAEKFVLYQNYPNPFNSSTNLRYQVPVSGTIVVTVYDMLGRDVATLVDAPHTAGIHSVRFVGTDLASGVYLVSLRHGTGAIHRKITLLK